MRVSDSTRWSLVVTVIASQIQNILPPSLQSPTQVMTQFSRGNMGFSVKQVMENRYSSRLSPSKDARFDRIKINRSNFPRMLLQHYIIEKYIFKT